MSTLSDAVQRLAVARQAADLAAEVLRVKRDQFAADNAALLATEREAKAAVTQAEADVRALGEAAYTATKEKKPIAGVEIKLFKVYTIDEEKGLAWARETKLCLVPERLDLEAVKKVAVATPLPFVKVHDEPKAQIAKDLSAYLPAEPLEMDVPDFEIVDAPAREPRTSAESQTYIDTGEKPKRRAKRAPVAPVPDDEDPFA